MSRFLIYSQCGDGIGLAQWLQEIDDHEVYFYCKNEDFRDCGKGIVNHVSSLNAGLAKSPEAVIFDMSGDGELADKLGTQGYPTVGAGKFNDLIENDRSYGMDLCRRVGIAVPDYKVFKKTELEVAIKFIEESGKTYVLKPDNNLALELTYVSKDAEDMVKYLRWCEEQKLLKGDFLLQEKVEGVEISTEVWFSHGRPLEGPNGTMEIKKFMTGNLGQATGCESSIVFPYQSLMTPIVQKTIAKLYPILEQVKYTGPLDINSIVAEDGTAYFLEFTPRFGYSAIYALIELMPENLGDFLMEVAMGESQKVVMDKPYAMTLTLSVPPYPLDSGHDWTKKAFAKTANKRVSGLPEGYFFPYDLKREKDEYRTAGILGLVGYLSYPGNSLQEVNDIIYDQVKKIEIPDMQYRIDGSERAKEDIPKLREYGFEAPELTEKEKVNA